MALAVLFLVNFLTFEKSPTQSLKPWLVKVDNAGGSQVFGLKFNRSNVADALKIFAGEAQFALIKNKNLPQEIKLEVFYERINLSGITGKLVLVYKGSGDIKKINAWHSQEKLSLNPDEQFVHVKKDELAELKFLKLSSITLIPSVDLTEERLGATFGTAKEIIKLDEATTHYLYTEIGVDVALNTNTKDVIQYVPLADFYLVREPLIENTLKQ